jgi:hypothetical protein
MSEASRREAAHRLTLFRWRGAPPETAVDFSVPRRCVDEAQWLNTAVPPSLPNHFPGHSWLSVHPSEFFNRVTAVRQYEDLCFSHVIELAAALGPAALAAAAESAVPASAVAELSTRPLLSIVDPLEE